MIIIKDTVNRETASCIKDYLDEVVSPWEGSEFRGDDENYMHMSWHGIDNKWIITIGWKCVVVDVPTRPDIESFLALKYG